MEAGDSQAGARKPPSFGPLIGEAGFGVHKATCEDDHVVTSSRLRMRESMGVIARDSVNAPDVRGEVVLQLEMHQ